MLYHHLISLSKLCTGQAKPNVVKLKIIWPKRGIISSNLVVGDISMLDAITNHCKLEQIYRLCDQQLLIIKKKTQRKNNKFNISTIHCVNHKCSVVLLVAWGKGKIEYLEKKKRKKENHIHTSRDGHCGCSVCFHNKKRRKRYISSATCNSTVRVLRSNALQWWSHKKNRNKC